MVQQVLSRPLSIVSSSDELTEASRAQHSQPAQELGVKPVPSQAEIQALVARAQQGDSQAFAVLYDTYAKKIHSYLRYHLNNRAEVAEDLAADVFMKALEKINSYQFNGVPFSALPHCAQPPDRLPARPAQEARRLA